MRMPSVPFWLTAFLASCGAFAPGLIGAAEEPKEEVPGIPGPILVAGGVSSPDGRFRLRYWKEEGAAFPFTGVRVDQPQREKVMWRDQPDDGDQAYSDVSGLWSPGGGRLAVMLSMKRSQRTLILEMKEGKFAERSVKEVRPPLEKDLGTDVAWRFENVSAEKWIDEDTVALVYSGRIQIHPGEGPGAAKPDWRTYEYRATLSLRDGTITFDEKGKKLEACEE